MSLTDEQKEIVKSTAPMFKEHGKEITSILYKHLFAAHPELLDIFNRTNQKNGTQSSALANIIFLAIQNIDHLDALLPQLLIIAHKHRASTVLPQHYPILGKYLLLAIDEFLGGTGDPSMLNAWSAAYTMIANTFIDMEKKLYDELGDEHEQGFIPFTIINKEMITSELVAFTFERSDGRKLHDYHSGQYITLRIKIDEHYHIRQYSLIQPFHSKTYRIAIKKEIDHEPKGIISNEIINNYKEGDQILATLPAGTFILIQNAKHHLFIAGGIGITVLSSMILDLHKQNKSNIITLIHCVLKEDQAAFADQMHTILSENQYYVILQSKHLLQGTIEETLTPDTHVYLCGSTIFINKAEDYLAQCEHPSSQIHIEAYQPSLSLIKDAVKNQSVTKEL